MSALAASPAYAALLTRYPPRVIKTEAENEHFIEALYDLDAREATWSPEERDLAELLTLLIEDFEEKHYSLPKSTPADMLAFLLDQQAWTVKDVADIFGTEDEASRILHGERGLARREVLALSERFHVSPELFE